ncbi:pyroglutamyl-peptidase I [Oceanirhabdus seepicola]|uniref:Pyrrolidone-carboxylate peptidase n=1 Tax=Oceanirhabdus seepicola TaxID=2828781 RepID=A0A9J6P1S0_9CLOT|nr:pyroglutamyl-peptidase I [Oceanirhabdus seepicola]MCM1989993.1 pyroglutamyl-peptidase I [Oceanirhabdus seepicola]
MKVLITGFTPFGGESLNPAYEAVKLLNNEIAGAEIVKAEIPTVFRESIKCLEEIIEKEKPDIAICIGQAGGRFEISIERIAINLDDARIPDNENNAPIDEVIFEDGENAYFAKLPIKAMVNEIIEEKIPAAVSNSAGTFVCNHLMYGLLYLIDKKYPNMKGGFIHVPFIPEQVVNKRNMAAMALDDIVKGLSCAIRAAVENDEDIKKTGGTIC